MANQIKLDDSTSAEDLLGHSSVQVAVAGVGGYAGGELARLLLRHPRFSEHLPLFLGRSNTALPELPTSLADLHPQLTVDDEISVMPFSWKTLESQGIELLLLATPAEQSRRWVPEAIARGMRVIDLSGAWRLKKLENRAVYNFSDEQDSIQMLQEEAVYGSPELHRDTIRSARLVANPGCYATSVILALAPLVASSSIDLNYGIICDSKSGVSGAGKTPTPGTHFMYAADNFSAYSIFGHRHTGELLEQLHLTKQEIQFTPHLLPVPRGILSTIYLRLKRGHTPKSVSEIMHAFYDKELFVRLRKPGALPDIQQVVRTNFCDLGIAVENDGQRAVLISCLDNLLKGAAGQAVQNLNLMCGWGESEGLL